MSGAGLQICRSHGDDWFYTPGRGRRSNRYGQFNRKESFSSRSAFVDADQCKTESRTAASDELAVPACSPPSEPRRSNLDRFMEATTPAVPVQFLSKTKIRGRKVCDVKSDAYFSLEDLWDSFREWSAYGAGVPLVLNERDPCIQYYVPYLSGIQIYGRSSSSKTKSRQNGEETINGYCGSSCSEGNSDCELEKCSRYTSGDKWRRHCSAMDEVVSLRMESLSLKEKPKQECFSSSDNGRVNSVRDSLLFEYFEHDQPYSREPLADKILNLTSHFPELMTLRSCELVSASWMSVAWYPIYRIPTRSTLKDLDACFLTFHFLSTQMRVPRSEPIVAYPYGTDDVPKILLPSFGLASYKFKGSLWTQEEVCAQQLANSLSDAAEKWLRVLEVNHPDYLFFASNGAYRR